jgi:hypothetical protein
MGFYTAKTKAYDELAANYVAIDWVFWHSMIKPNELGQPVTEADLLPFVNAQAPIYRQVIEVIE